jgi:hypothetical protein
MSDQIIMHTGVKGMRWGVRKAPVAHPVSGDALKVKKAKTLARTHGMAALSNKDIQDAIKRMDLEQNYKRLEFATKPRNAGATFAMNLLGSIAKTTVSDLASTAVRTAVSPVKVKLSG